MAFFQYGIVCVLAYLLGSVSMSIIITKYIYKDDVRDHGSGNAGATNVARTYGWFPGIITFVCDFCKCAASMAIGRHFGGEWGFALAGIFCLIGHCFPVFFGFRGGKAVSTGACVAFLVDPRLFLIMAVIFFAVAFTTKYVSLSSLCAAAAFIAGAFLMPFSVAVRILAVFTGILVIFMHRSNIRRLLSGTESRFHPGSRKKNGS